MRAEINHLGNFTFETTIRDHKLMQDVQASGGGDNKGPTPKELLLAGIIGCAGMDVVSLLKKYGTPAESFKITAEAEPRKEHPRIFSGVDIVFAATGARVEASRLNEAVHLSLTKFCGVTAMVSKVVPVRYRVVLNDLEVGTGQADFGL